MSKAISRLEQESGTKLFQKMGRHIYLTAEGELLRERELQILRLAENAQRDLKAMSTSLHLRIVGPEPLLVYASQGTLSKYTKAYRSFKIEYGIASEESALNQIRNGTADIAFITGKRPPEMRGSSIGEAHFSTFVGHGHELYERASKG